MSAALLRRGLELLGAPEGEALPEDVRSGGKVAGAGGSSPEGAERSKPVLASVGWEP